MCQFQEPLKFDSENWSATFKTLTIPLNFDNLTGCTVKLSCNNLEPISILLNGRAESIVSLKNLLDENLNCESVRTYLQCGDTNPFTVSVIHTYRIRIVAVALPHINYTVQFNPILARKLMIATEPITAPFTVISRDCVNVVHGFESIYLFSNMTEPILINNSLQSLSGIYKLDFKQKVSSVELELRSPYKITTSCNIPFKISRSEFKTFTFYLCNEYMTPIHYRISPTFQIIAHFQKYCFV